MRITIGLILLCFAGCSDDNGGAGLDAKVGQDQAIADQGASVDQAVADDLGASSDQAVSADQAVDPDQNIDPDQTVVQLDLFRPQPKDLGPPTDGGGINITCNAQVGTGTVTGSVAGSAVKVTHAGGVSITAMGITGWGVAFIDQGGSCSSLAQVANPPKLWILLCDNKPGTYAVGSSCKPDGGGSWIGFTNQVSIPMPGTDIKATSGTVTITSLDTACGKQVKGSFSVSFSGDKVSGSFDTVGCGTVSL
jgi:hypothetical protein